MSAKRRSEFLARVIDAFREMDYPLQDALFTNLFYAESVGLDKAFEGKQWQEISKDVAIKYRIDIAYFTPHGFSYFLPSFLLTLLTVPLEADTLDLEIIFELSPQAISSDIPVSYQLEKVRELRNQLSESQRDVVFYFLYNYRELFSEDEFELMEHELSILNKAVEFWKRE